jgi:hypothetical protein
VSRCDHELRWPRQITPPSLPPYPPALNPVERLWHWLREHHWSNRNDADEQALVDEAIRGPSNAPPEGTPVDLKTGWLTPGGSLVTA